MRCLNRVYDAAGDCPVCHMKLKPYVAVKRTSLGYSCPLHRSKKVFDKGGLCPFCGLQLKEVFDGPPPPHGTASTLRLWPLVDGKTALYHRPYEVRKIAVDRLLRGAGRIRGLRMTMELSRAQAAGLSRGDSAMVMPPQGFSRQIQAEVESVAPGGRTILRLSRPIPGASWGLAEIRGVWEPSLAVPLEALLESGGSTRVFVRHGETFEPREVSVTARGESLASVTGVGEGEVVAGSGVFWLEAEWRMGHP